MLYRSLAVGFCLFLSSIAAAGPEGAPTARPPKFPAFNPGAAPVQRPPDRILPSPFTIPGPRSGLFVVRADLDALAAGMGQVGSALIQGFPLSPAERVDLEVERFWVTSPGAQFVLGGDQAGAGDATFAFDPASVILLRGRVVGRPRSRVFLGLSPWVNNGIIDFGPGEERFGVSSRGPGGASLPAGELAVFRAVAAGSHNPIPFCTVLNPPGGIDPGQDPTDSPRKGLRQIQLAVETDYEFFQLFGDAAATSAYLVENYGAVSDVFMREINVRVDLTYVRVWPQPNEPFDAGLNQFQGYWNANMQSVQRDNAQMLSGRGDLPGGVAYLNSICTSSAYAFCGNAVGFFADAETSGVYTYDPMVCAHELGHNFGSQHTDFYNIDTCNLVNTVPRRGTIMSYCNQVVSGGLSVIDMRFHKGTQNPMKTYIASRACAVFDCNQNGVADSIDIAQAVSADVNGNGIPDECEDCNGNQVLDTIDISGGASLDLNGNGIPDECEPDCNHNNIPDDRDIALGTSQDLHGDNQPDECDADRNNNGQSDYNEIVANMTLDKDRDVILDSTQDCDGDTVPDLTELEGAWDVWTIANQENVIREYHSEVGVLMRVGQTGVLNNAQDLIVIPDRRVLVTSAGTNSVVEFNRLGQFVRNLVSAGSGGLTFPTDLTRTPSGDLLVCSKTTSSVLRYNITTGASLGAFIPAASGGLASPTAMVYSPGGTLLVAGDDNRVREYNGTTGAFIRILVNLAGNGGLSSPRGMTFNAQGRLLVTSFDTDEVLEYDGLSGAFLRSLLVTGLPVDGPWCVRMGPLDGFLYVSRFNNFADTHLTRARIFIFDPRLGNFIRAHTQALDSGLSFPTGFDFMPGNTTDCNQNRRPDSCDIAQGYSFDMDGNGVPDECQGLCYANCDLSTTAPVLNVADFTCFLQRFAAASPYANCDHSTTAPTLNVADFTCFLQRFAAGCP